MSSIDTHNQIDPTVGFQYENLNADATVDGVIIDTQKYYSLEYLVLAGGITQGTHSVTIEHGDDFALADAAAVPSAFLLGTLADVVFTNPVQNTVKKIGYVGHKRYVRMSFTSTGTAGGDFNHFQSAAVNNSPRHVPVS